MKPVLLLGKCVRRLRRDEGGSVLLLSGMMAFLIAIMSLYSMDTSQAVYNRIVAQNASDGAAETAALWQARGLNLLQILNNFHYQCNATIFALESAALVTCTTIPEAVLGEQGCCYGGEIFGCDCPGAIEGVSGLCTICNSAGTLNDLQNTVATSILDMQAGITYLFPGLAFVYANQVANISGGDNLMDVVPVYVNQTVSEMLQAAGIPIPDSINSSGSSPINNFTSCLPGIYAFPIDPFSVSLNTQSVPGQNWPWKWNLFDLPEEVWKTAADAAWEVGKWSCRGDDLQFGQWFSSFDDRDSPSDWGWDDKYYQGHPGVMTWMAGKTNQTELAGLGSLRWLNPNPSPPPDISYWMSQSNLPMYTGPVLTSSALTIPAFVAVASSQVEGTGVIGKDISIFGDAGGNPLSVAENILDQVDIFDEPPVDSTPRLISVFFGPTTAGTDLLIYH